MTAVLSEQPLWRPNPLRALPIPDTEPAPDPQPYRPDGRDRGGHLPSPSQGRLALMSRQPTLALAPVTAPDDSLAEPAFDQFGPRPTGRAELPDPTAWTRRLVQAVIEVVTGVRPAAQLVRWASPEVYAGLQRRGRARGRALPGRRAVVRSVHVCEPADGVVEACAVVIAGGRARAVALRLEGLDGRWRMTALQIG